MYFPPLPEIFCAASLFCVCEQKKKAKAAILGCKMAAPPSCYVAGKMNAERGEFNWRWGGTTTYDTGSPDSRNCQRSFAVLID